jgi:hypothetical protein
VKAGFLLLLAFLVVRPAAAQTVVRPDPPLDSTRAALRDALLLLRDSLTTVDGAAARLQRDYRNASGPALLSRAGVMYDACVRSGKALPPARATVLSTPLSQAFKIKRRKELLVEMDQLKTALAKCESEFGEMRKPGQAERVRGYGNDRAVRVQSALRGYEKAMGDYLGAMGIKVIPPGISADRA